MTRDRYTILDSDIDVIALESLPQDLCNQVCAIKVSGLEASMTHDLIECYFENERRSGGSDIEEIWYDDTKETVVITYKSPSSRCSTFICITLLLNLE